MASGKEEANFAVNLEGTAADSAKRTGDAMEDMRARIEASQAAIKGMAAAMRLLRGPGAEIQKQRDELNAKLKAERQSLGLAQSALVKQGTSYDKLSEKIKKAKEAQKELSDKRAKAMSAALSTAGGPVAQLAARFETLKSVLGGQGGGGAVGALGLLTLGTAAAVAAIVGVTAALAAGVVGFAKWALAGADAARSTRLFRESAMGGNAQWGATFGAQVDELAKRVPLARSKLDELGAGLARNKIGGQAWVDAMAAVAGATAGLDEEAGRNIEDFITRARQFNRFRLDPREMTRSAVTFEEVAQALGTKMKGGVAEARKALYQGHVSMAAGAAALKDAVEKKFGAINMQKALSLDSIAQRMRESIGALTSGINLEPVLKGLASLASMLDQSTETGKALKATVTAIGNTLGKAFTDSVPAMRKAILRGVIALQELVIWGLKARNGVRDFAEKNQDKIAMLGSLFDGLKVAAGGAAIGLGLLAGAMVAVVGAQVALMAGIGKVSGAIQGIGESVGKWLNKAYFEAFGETIIEGIVNGIKRGYGKAKEAILGLANSIKSAFTSKEGIDSHSPSKWFEKRADDVSDGFTGGLDRNAGKVESAGVDLANAAKAGASSAGGGAVAGGGGGRGGRIAVDLTLRVEGGGGGGGQAPALDAGTIARIADLVSKRIVDEIQLMGVAAA